MGSSQEAYSGYPGRVWCHRQQTVTSSKAGEEMAEREREEKVYKKAAGNFYISSTAML